MRKRTQQDLRQGQRAATAATSRYRCTYVGPTGWETSIMVDKIRKDWKMAAAKYRRPNGAGAEAKGAEANKGGKMSNTQVFTTDRPQTALPSLKFVIWDTGASDPEG